MKSRSSSHYTFEHLHFPFVPCSDLTDVHVSFCDTKSKWMGCVWDFTEKNHWNNAIRLQPVSVTREILQPGQQLIGVREEGEPERRREIRRRQSVGEVQKKQTFGGKSRRINRTGKMSKHREWKRWKTGKQEEKRLKTQHYRLTITSGCSWTETQYSKKQRSAWCCSYFILKIN